ETVSATSTARPNRLTAKASTERGPRAGQVLFPFCGKELRNLIGGGREVEVLGIGIILGIGEERDPIGFLGDPLQHLLPGGLGLCGVGLRVAPPTHSLDLGAVVRSVGPGQESVGAPGQNVGHRIRPPSAVGGGGAPLAPGLKKGGLREMGGLWLVPALARSPD